MSEDIDYDPCPCPGCINWMLEGSNACIGCLELDDGDDFDFDSVDEVDWDEEEYP